MSYSADRRRRRRKVNLLTESFRSLETNFEKRLLIAQHVALNSINVVGHLLPDRPSGQFRH